MQKIILALLLFSFASCKNNSPVALSDADWLIGTWKGVTKSNNVFYESWQRINDTLFTNFNYRIVDGDTVVGGKSKIFLSKNKVFYSNGMNDSTTMQWRASKFTDTEIVFENGSLEKILTIKFELTNNNTWQATVMGSKDTTNYSLERIN